MSSNKLSHLFESSGLEWSSILISLDQFSTLSHSFPLRPNDYLSFALEDIRIGGTRGYVNAISNAKRAIDCQAESIVYSLGYQPSELKTQLGKFLVSKIEKESSENSLPFVFRFLESLGVFMPAIVERVRNLRHEVEHRFQKPNKKRASEALEISTLFVKAAESITVNFYESFSFGSNPKNFHNLTLPLLEKEFYFRFKCTDKKPHAEVDFWNRLLPLGSPSPKTIILPQHESYYWLVMMALALSREADVQPILRNLLSASKAKIISKKIKVLGYA